MTRPHSTQPAPDFTIADVLAWARTKPADQAYEYIDPWNCAVCQFLRDTGRAAAPTVRGNKWGEGICIPKTPFDDRIRAAANPSTTFGELVARLEKLCPETIVTPSEWTQLDAYLTDIEQVSA